MFGRQSVRRLNQEGQRITAWPSSDEFGGLNLDAMLVDVPSDGSYVDVVGESNYQSALLVASGGKSVDGAIQPDHVGIMLPEPSNVYDRNAVRVFLPAGLVGYLSRDDAVAYRQVIDRLAAAGSVLAARARITGGWDDGDGDRGSFGVRLYMGSPSELASELADSITTVEQTPPALPAADWFPDPTERHQWRYWDGAVWTEHVANDGVAATDPLG